MVKQAVILVGGEGTRLRPLTSHVPKPVLEVVDRPFLAHMLDWLASHGITEAVLCCGFKADVLVAHLGQGVVNGVRLTYVNEPEPRGTAGALKFAAAEAKLDERFVMVNGDLLTNLDLSAQIAAHDATGATGTLGLVAVEDPSQFGLVRLNADQTVLSFVEKPRPDQIDTDLISAGCYVLERAVLDLIPADANVSIEREVFPQLVGEGLYGYPHRTAYFMDLGTPERYLDGIRDILSGRLASSTHGLLDERGVHVDPTAEVHGTVVGPAWVAAGAVVGAGSRIGPNSVVGQSVQIGAGVAVHDSVVLTGAVLEDDVQLYRAVVGHHAQVGTGTVLGALAVVGPNTVVPAGTIVPPEGKLEADLGVTDA